MSHIRSTNTQLEVNFRKLLWKNNIRGYRIRTTLIGKPDIYFPKSKIAIFIDGCYWHKCPNCYVPAKSNEDYWIRKIENNVQRDQRVNEELINQGIRVIRFWEHEIKEDQENCLSQIVSLLGEK